MRVDKDYSPILKAYLGLGFLVLPRMLRRAPVFDRRALFPGKKEPWISIAVIEKG
jgi:hypothetical protein